ncbi:N-acetyltransferase [Paenibacillus algorifonticola]|uniref:GNAT family N-acetyltransferase n=1 Tax=Paenibacillus algorifonticola TaxID=684063 RepID=UPI003D2DE651
MNQEQLIALFTKEQRIEITFPGYRREQEGGVIRQIALENESEGGFVLHTDLNENNVDEAIVKQLAYFRELKQSFEWKVYSDDKPSNLKERLLAHGFNIGEEEAMMVIQLADGHELLQYEIPTSIRPVTDAAGIDALVALEETVWGVPHAEHGERLKQDLQDKQIGLHIYAAYDGDQMVSAAWMYLHEGTSFASIWGGSTLAEYRGKGHYSALLAVRAQAAWRAGFRLMTVDASPMSRPILARRGFELLAYTWPCQSPVHNI